jgi:hypothetical protein
LGGLRSLSLRPHRQLPTLPIWARHCDPFAARFRSHPRFRVGRSSHGSIACSPGRHRQRLRYYYAPMGHAPLCHILATGFVQRCPFADSGISTRVPWPEVLSVSGRKHPPLPHAAASADRVSVSTLPPRAPGPVSSPHPPRPQPSVAGDSRYIDVQVHSLEVAALPSPKLLYLVSTFTLLKSLPDPN